MASLRLSSLVSKALGLVLAFVQQQIDVFKEELSAFLKRDLARRAACG
jgi:hypothetical protein